MKQTGTNRENQQLQLFDHDQPQALNKINESGRVLGRPLGIHYADDACKADIGVPATKRLIEQDTSQC
jgi:ABC-type branched-subunit amino acid transport system substrate-binding protein